MPLPSPPDALQGPRSPSPAPDGVPMCPIPTAQPLHPLAGHGQTQVPLYTPCPPPLLKPQNEVTSAPLVPLPHRFPPLQPPLPTFPPPSIRVP